MVWVLKCSMTQGRVLPSLSHWVQHVYQQFYSGFELYDNQIIEWYYPNVFWLNLPINMCMMLFLWSILLQLTFHVWHCAKKNLHVDVFLTNTLCLFFLSPTFLCTPSGQNAPTVCLQVPISWPCRPKIAAGKGNEAKCFLLFIWALCPNGIFYRSYIRTAGKGGNTRYSPMNVVPH